MVPCSNLPATRSEHAKVRLNTAITWFIWKGATFRVPLSTLQRSKDDGGWDMIHLKAKCLALLLHRTRIQSQDPETFTAVWLEKWNITERSPNPPHRGELPATIEYLRRIYRESAYVPPYDKTVTNRVNKRRLYTTVHTMMRAEAGSQELRISRLKTQYPLGSGVEEPTRRTSTPKGKSRMVQGDTRYNTNARPASKNSTRTLKHVPNLFRS